MPRSNRKPFAKKSLGQNFLSDPTYIRKVIEAVGPKAGESIVEIGPGRGAITEELIDSGANVTAVELDLDLSIILSQRFSENANFTLIEGDVLEIDLRQLAVEFGDDDAGDPKKRKLVANLPYYISTAVLQNLVDQRHGFSDLVLMFQLEVVERITAKPGDSERGYLTVIAEAAFGIEKLFDVPPSAFIPRPKVRSAVVRLKPKPANEFDDRTFRNLLGTSFAHKRKTLANNLRAHYPNFLEILTRAEVDPQLRAESLTLEQWSRLKDAFCRP